ncbi:MAG: biopolymer transporter ExbD [Polyangiaceae bacterium]
MAGVDVGSGGASARRSLTQEINMVPMIDLLMVTISFLLITAVWTHMSRMDANASVPRTCDGRDCDKPPEAQKTLHVDMKDPARFVLSWRRGKETLDHFEVPRTRVNVLQGKEQVARYPELAAKIDETWKASGDHRALEDRARDRAVLHTDDAASFSDLVAVMDAIRSVERPVAGETRESRASKQPAFDLIFSMN